MQVFVDAFERAGSLDPQKVRDALAATDLMTFYGPIEFDATGKNIAKSMVLLQVQNGEYVVVAPSKWAEAKGRLSDADLGRKVIGAARATQRRGTPMDNRPAPPASGRSRSCLIDGMLIGAIFALAAYGMALVWGVMNIINVCQGEFVMLGGYVAFTLARRAAAAAGRAGRGGLPSSSLGWLSTASSSSASSSAISFVSLLATFGIAILLEQLMNKIFGANLRDPRRPSRHLVPVRRHRHDRPDQGASPSPSPFWPPPPVTSFMRRSRLGQAIRATAQNARAARILGIDTDRVYAMTFALNARDLRRLRRAGGDDLGDPALRRPDLSPCAPS